jgi:two-component system, chemotaxis family, sensor kinase CheA
MDDFTLELKQDFLTEAEQLLNESEQAFLELENNKDDQNLMDQIFRLAHNLKGTSRAVGFGEVAEFTHEMENLILKVKNNEIPVTDEVVNTLLSCNDHLGAMISLLNMDLDAKIDSSEVVDKIKAVLGGGGEISEVVDPGAGAAPEMPADDHIAPASQSIEIEIVNDETSNQVVEETSLKAQNEVLATPAPAAEVDLANYDKAKPAQNDEEGVKFFVGEDELDTEKKKVPEIKRPTEVKEKRAPSKKKVEDENIRVSLSRVETLNNFVGELVILQSVLNQHKDAIQSTLLLKSVGQLGKLSKEIQDISMSLRMIPLKQTLLKMQRIVRDTSKALNKKVKLKLVGEDTEIDKTVLDHLSDPLVHIVRNACDHGLESTEKRIEVGKSEEGVVTISCYHEGNNLCIEVSDDGGGINPKIIENIALQKGVIGPDQSLSDREKINLIFHPGFSTKEEVSEISGRGVGMDVVKNNIERLSGDVIVDSVMGKGSTFRVLLPLTMAIIEAMVVQVGAEKYVFPLSQIHETLRPTKETIHHVNGVGECLNLRGEVLPMFRLSKTLKRPCEDVPAEELIAVIIKSKSFTFAVLIDEILHQQQVVVKQLGSEIRNKTGFMGSSILGDGKPAFIIDLSELYLDKMRKTTSTSKRIEGAA